MRRSPGIIDAAVRQAMWDMADEYNRGHLVPIFNTATFDDTSTAVLEELSFDVGTPGALLLIDFWAQWSVTAGVAGDAFVYFLLDGEAQDEAFAVVDRVAANPSRGGAARTRDVWVRPGRHTLSVEASQPSMTTFTGRYGYRIQRFVPAQMANRAY